MEEGLIGAVIGSESSKARFNEVSSMFNYGFNNYSNKCVIDCNVPLNEQLKLNGTKNTYYSVKPEKNFYVFCKRNQKDEIKTSAELYNVKLPVKANDVVGKITIYNKGVEIGSVNVVSVCDIDKLSYFDNIKEIIDNWAI